MEEKKVLDKDILMIKTTMFMRGNEIFDVKE